MAAKKAPPPPTAELAKQAEDEGFMRTKDVAAFLGISRTGVYELIADGTLSSFKGERKTRLLLKAAVKAYARRIVEGEKPKTEGDT